MKIDVMKIMPGFIRTGYKKMNDNNQKEVGQCQPIKVYHGTLKHSLFGVWLVAGHL